MEEYSFARRWLRIGIFAVVVIFFTLYVLYSFIAKTRYEPFTSLTKGTVLSKERSGNSFKLVCTDIDSQQTYEIVASEEQGLKVKVGDPVEWVSPWDDPSRRYLREEISGLGLITWLGFLLIESVGVVLLFRKFVNEWRNVQAVPAHLEEDVGPITRLSDP